MATEDLSTLSAVFRQNLQDNPTTRYGIQAAVAHYLLETPPPGTLKAALDAANVVLALVVGE
jgi:hypothetical protein